MTQASKTALKTSSLQVLLPAKVAQQIRDQAKKEGLSVSTWLRVALIAKMEMIQTQRKSARDW